MTNSISTSELVDNVEVLIDSKETIFIHDDSNKKVNLVMLPYDTFLALTMSIEEYQDLTNR